MQYIAQSATPIDAGFMKQVEDKSGTSICRCYQCLTCTLSCPASFAMDYLPHQVVRMVQAGLKQSVLNSHTIWVCADCMACAARCPNEIDIPALMDTLREMALSEGKSSEQGITNFHRLFLSNIATWGRQHELSLILQHKLKTRNLLSDLGPGMQMLVKGKLRLLPMRLKEIGAVRNIFRRTGSDVR